MGMSDQVFDGSHLHLVIIIMDHQVNFIDEAFSFYSDRAFLRLLP